MKLDLTGLHIDITEGIENYTKERIKKLESFFDDDTICHVTFSSNKGLHHVDVRVEYKGRTYLAVDESHDLYQGIEKTTHKIEGQAMKVKTALEKKRRSGIDDKTLDSMSIEQALEGEEE